MANVLLVMGHRKNNRGNEEELRRTPLVVEAAERALRRAGHSVHVLQREDADSDPDWTDASLRYVGERCAKLIRQHNINVMIDAHFQGSSNPVPGCFCLFPDGDGLQRVLDYKGSDSKASNPLDVAVASRLAKEISSLTGIRQLPLQEPGGLGAMSERQSNVAITERWRLGMFDLTSGVRKQCVRLIMEHGDITADSAVIDAPGFHDKVARAYVRTVNAFWPSRPGPASSTPFYTYAPPQLFHAQPGGVGRKRASTESEAVRRFKGGEEIWAVGYYESQEVFGDRRWLRVGGTRPFRIHRSGVVEEPAPGTLQERPDSRGGSDADGEWSTTEGEQPRDAELTRLADTQSLGCSDLASVAPSDRADGETVNG
jgi:hypothetical protein